MILFVIAACKVEFWHVVSAEPLNIVEKPRKTMAGTTRGNALTGVPAPSTSWVLQLGEKRRLYGPRGKIEVGGATPGLQGQASPRRQESDVEAVAHRPVSATVLSELQHAHGFSAWLNLTSCEGQLEDCCHAHVRWS